ncbi:aldo/keto reductase [Paenibacillus beijingensis]|uniref:Aldo/keto reductase n=1 Tax=Paenibacillus beijingensis TaxID=1126833 RepID=A0A0D5NJQ9_9BACL|nr:aldo/keto reductase [Paenibacillus beijingensis]AJY75222.1 aldo/keto reductase [Paenibacillus beijingensis]
MNAIKPIPLQQRGLAASQLVLGCMGLGGGWDNSPVTAEHIKEGHAAVEAALESGITMFDHADIYTRGKAEQVFGQILRDKPDLRESIIIQSKCGIKLGSGEDGSNHFDFSEAHITSSVDGILQRLGVEYLDILLLHRPDPLMEPEEVARAFARLKESGKVRYFGVSNMSAGQIRLLQAYTEEPIVANQLEMSLERIGFLETGVHVNQEAAKDNVFPEGTLEFCRLENIQLQAWSPLAKGLFSGRPLDDQPDHVKKTAQLVGRLAEEKGTTREAVVLAWLMTHPAAIQPVIGTSNPARIRACKDAARLRLTRSEWYNLYTASRGKVLP